MRTWTFLTSHAQVLLSIAADPTRTTREIAARLGITERAVQRIVSDLEVSGYLSKQKSGRRNSYQLHLDQPLRHPAQSNRPVGELLQVLSKQDNNALSDTVELKVPSGTDGVSIK